MLPLPHQIKKIDSPFDVSLALPGSKSIALRQLAMCALTKGSSTLQGIPVCEDTDAMIGCLLSLGLRVKQDTNGTVVEGPMNLDREVQLDVQMSGASTRLLIALSALRSGTTNFDGHESLRARTNKPLLDVLEANGCSVDSRQGHLPLSIKGPITPKHSMIIDGSISSQYVSALLILSVGLNEPIVRTLHVTGQLVSKPYIDITLNEMAKRGVRANWADKAKIEIESNEYFKADEVAIEGDATAATYSSALACIHQGRVTFTNLGKNTHQGDFKFFELLEQLGAKIQKTEHTTSVVGPAQLNALATVDMTDMPDAALTLIALAPLLPEKLLIAGLSSLHHKECDRLECPAKELSKLGIFSQTTQDTIQVKPISRDKILPGVVCSYHDHRMAMAFSLIGSVSGNISIDDKTVVNKTYPEFWKDYEKLLNNP